MVTRTALLEELRALIHDVHTRDAEERRKRIRSAFGFPVGRPIPDQFITAKQLPCYSITVNTDTYRTLLARAACAPILARYVSDPDVIQLIKEA